MSNRIPRRKFLKNGALFLGSTLAFTKTQTDPLLLDASTAPPPAIETGFYMGTSTSISGNTITLNSRTLMRNGKPWVFMSGEFHFSRCPEAEWRDELLKIKAGGISLVTTYIFWIHHEEVEGVWNWTGQRDLKRFIETCKQAGLDVLLRIGPWCHGEVLNGGFPDWLQKKGERKELELRRDNPVYLSFVSKLFEQINQQAKGFLWKEDGPVIAAQLENEFSGPPKHLLTLKKMARKAGLDVPLYTYTSWSGSGPDLRGEMIPSSGAYAEGFWDRSLVSMPKAYNNVFKFSGSQNASALAMGALGEKPSTSNPGKGSSSSGPLLTCELGAGMMSSYHRRLVMYPEDTLSLATTRLGSGANLLGFYMYHGGQNPDGILSYLNETQASGYWNDLPVKNYDFQAPIGQYGQLRPHYHHLRLIGLFLADFGSSLSGMTSRIPSKQGPLSWAVRSDGKSGYLFLNHYKRLAEQPVEEGVQFRIKFAGSELTLPSAPVTINYNGRFFWPLNIELGGIKLIYASAQPVTQIIYDACYTVFKQTSVVPAEFVFDAATATILASTGEITQIGKKIQVSKVLPGLGAAIELRAASGKKLIIILLDEATSLSLYKANWHGLDRLFLSQAALLFDEHDGDKLRMLTTGKENSISVFPAPSNLSDGNGPVRSEPYGLFTRFVASAPSFQPVFATVEKIKAAGTLRAAQVAPSVSSRREGVAMQPNDADFARAAVWRIRLPANLDTGRDLRLIIRYTGDVARAYLGDKFIDDDFNNTRPFEIGLRRYGKAAYRDGLMLKVLPLDKRSPILFTESSKLKFNTDGVAVGVDGVEVIETKEIHLSVMI